MAQNPSTLQEIILGALLHDIGKAAQRASPTPRAKRHQEFGAEWLESLRPEETRDLLWPAREFILRHHALSRKDPKYVDLDVLSHPRGDLLIVWEADNLASGSERHKEDPDEPSPEALQYDPTLPLYSVLLRVHLQHAPPFQKAYPPLDLGNDRDLALRFYPEDPQPLQQEDYKRLLKGFNEYLASLPQSQDPIQHLLNGLERFFSTVPSETGHHPNRPETFPDISLYDHLKSTAAIASALYLFFAHQEINPGQLNVDLVANRQEARYLLVGGDFSGVQDFIYNITYHAALKGLRARSLYLELLTEHVVQQLLDNLGLSRANLIYAGGGGFYLLAPNTQKTHQVLQRTRQNFNQWLFREHGGRLFLALDAVPLNGASFLPDEPAAGGIPKLSEAWQHLGQKLGEQKRHRFADLLSPEFFEPRDTQNRRVCPVCKQVVPEEQIHTVEDQEEGEARHLCVTCYALEKVGRALPKTKTIVVSDRPAQSTNGPFLRIQNLTYTFLSEPRSTARRVYALNRYEGDAIPLFMATHPESSLNFHEIVAKYSVGAPLLATLRADVDNLGQIFAQGIDTPYRSFARYTTLSRLLTLFFKRMVNLLAQGHLFPDLALTPVHPEGPERTRQFAVVYSGGDDLFITGVWADVVSFALELRRTFQRFVGNNPNLTLSAGIVLTGPKHPIYRIARLAGEAEEQAKALQHPEGSKNALALFDVVHPWPQWFDLLEQVLFPLLDLGTWNHRRFVPRFSRSLIYKLLDLQEQAQRLQTEGGVPLVVLPRLLYTLGRAKPKPDPQNPELETRWQQFVAPAVSPNPQEALEWLLNLRGPLIWLDLLIRGGEAS